jgi:hypothetical protein
LNREPRNHGTIPIHHPPSLQEHSKILKTGRLEGLEIIIHDLEEFLSFLSRTKRIPGGKKLNH